MELKSYQHYDSLRDVLKDKYSGDGRQIGRKDRKVEIRRPIKDITEQF